MNPGTEIWITGRQRHEDKPWELMGVFSSRDDAIAACSEWFDFIGPAVLGQRLPDETTLWEGSLYPLMAKVVRDAATEAAAAAEAPKPLLPTTSTITIVQVFESHPDVVTFELSSDLLVAQTERIAQLVYVMLANGMDPETLVQRITGEAYTT